MTKQRNKQITIKLTQHEFDLIQERLEVNETTFMAVIRKVFKLPEPLPMRGTKEYQELKGQTKSSSSADNG
jgi:hypothetical protein